MKKNRKKSYQRNAYYILGIGIITIYLGMLFAKSNFLQPFIADKILRFHVLANSDTVADQEMKEGVRDAVGMYLQPLLEEAKSLEETKRIVNAHMDEVIEISEETLMEAGFHYQVQAQIIETDFPEKTYGAYTFPKGRYEALQIVIGEGEGRNWWCVLYPNMCFRGSVFEVIEEEADTALREVLNPLEYAKVFDSGNVKTGFKFLEFFAR